MKKFKHKVAAITGAGSGIGQALAVELARQGCDLALCGRKMGPLKETAKKVRAVADVKVTLDSVDVSDRGAVFAWADKVVADHGRVNLLFNNAGVALGASAEEVSYENFEWIMDINFWGVVHGCKAFLPKLRASGDGHVVNISSLFGLLGLPGQSAYNASKFAVRGYTEALRQELDLEKGPVSATSVHPGGIKTNINKSARIDDSIKSIVRDTADAQEQFEKLLRTTSEDAAKQILRAVAKNKRRVLVGLDAKAMDKVVRIAPSLYQAFTVAGTRFTQR